MKLKRLLAFSLGMAMMVSIMPSFVLADETDSETTETTIVETTEPKETEEKTSKPKKTAEAAEPAETAPAESCPEASEDKTEDHEIPVQTENKDSMDAKVVVVDSGTCGENVKYSFDSNGNMTIYGSGEMDDWGYHSDIPWKSYKDKIKSVCFKGNVTFIAGYSFKGCTSLSKLVISNTVKKIGYNAFEGCDNLKNISIPNSVTYIDTGAFSDTGITSLTITNPNIEYGGSVFASCKKLKTVSLPEGMKGIEYAMFANCDNLTGVVIPSTVTGIAMNAFRECISLKSIVIPEGVTGIGKVAFWGCTGLTSVTIPDSLIHFGSRSFAYCSSIKTVTINPDTLAGLDSDVFFDCPNIVYIATKVDGDLVYVITNPATDGTGTVSLVSVKNKKTSVSVPATTVIDGVTYKVNRIATTAFFNDKTIKSVSIGANVIIIDASAFYGCSNLAKVYGGVMLKTIGNNAFARCPKLSSFTITSKYLSKIGATAFYKDSKLKTLKIKKTTKLTKKGVKYSLKGSSIKTVKVKKSKVRKYKKIFKKSNSGRKVRVKK